MKLIKFDMTNSSSRRASKISIIFYKNGVISISKQACIDIGLKNEMKVSIIQDEENPNDWFLMVDDPDGFNIYDAKGEVLKFSCAHVVRSIIDCFDIKAPSVSFDIATEPTMYEEMKMYAILTGTAKYREIEN